MCNPCKSKYRRAMKAGVEFHVNSVGVDETESDKVTTTNESSTIVSKNDKKKSFWQWESLDDTVVEEEEQKPWKFKCICGEGILHELIIII